jgi:hypothetical protein
MTTETAIRLMYEAQERMRKQDELDAKNANTK